MPRWWRSAVAEGMTDGEPMFRKATPKPTPAAAPAPFTADETLGVPEVVAAQTCAAAGDFDSLAGLQQGATTASNAHAVLLIAANSADVEQLWRWWAARPGDPLAATVYGLALIVEGWRVRGGGRARTVSAQAFDDFWGYLRAADAQLMLGTAEARTAVSAWAGLVTSSRGLQLPASETLRRYEQGVAAGGAGLLELQEQALQGVCKKWQGTHEQMFEFARSQASAGAPLPGNALVCLAHLETWVDECDVNGGDSQYMRQPTVLGEIRALAAVAWMPEFPVDFGGLAAHNVFAFALAMAGDPDAAARHIRYLGPRLRLFPWAYSTRRSALVAHLRARG